MSKASSDNDETRTEPFRAPKGTHDVLPPESGRWTALVAEFARHVELAGYGFIQSPMFEEIGVFRRMGEGTDVVRKEMYDFLDKGGRHIALRPEGTASVVRAFVQHRPLTPFKAWYVAPSFRYEAPQAGRFRQHHQLGVEVLGVADPDLDVEVIVMLADFYTRIGLRDLDLVINSMGTARDRRAYVDDLRSFLVDNIDRLAPGDRERVEAFPMRVLDSKHDDTRAVLEAAPDMLERLSDESARRFERVQSGLSSAGVGFRIDPALVRGLDYYTHTTFEFQSSALDSAQSTIGGGGRYDGLVEALGGPATPGIGFGTGIERLLLACDAEAVFGARDTGVDVYVVDVAGGETGRDLCLGLRREGIATDRAFESRSMKSQMKSADRSGASVVVIIGEDELDDGTATVRDMRGDRGQQRVARSGLVDHLRTLIDEM